MHLKWQEQVALLPSAFARGTVRFAIVFALG